MNTNSTRKRARRHGGGKALITVLAGAMAGLGVAGSAYGFQIETDNPDISMHWDNTVKYSAAWRVGKLDSRVEGSAYNPNIGDGDRNFGRGLISNRLDLLSEFDLRYKRDFGFRLSGAGWYDSVYNQSNDNNGSSLVNTTSVSAGEFAPHTRTLHGRKAEILDAFVFGRIAAGETNLNLRLGQFTQIYGESLFFGTNGIAAAQLSPDVIKATAVPGSQVKEIMMPVKQLTAQWQFSPGMSVGAYYQFEWRKARLPGAGSYFSFADFVDEGGESLFTPFGQLSRGDDLKASDSGQFGVQFKFKSGDVDLGLYAAQYHDKFPQFYVRPLSGDYVLVYGQNIQTIGASASSVIGETNVAAEASFRKDMPLAAVGNVVPLLPAIGTDPAADGDDNPAYPLGKTFHLNVSGISVFNGNALWDGASLVGEFAYNRVLSVSRNRDQLDPNTTKDAGALRMVFTPEYFQVLPQVDMQIPISVGLGLWGRSAVNGVGFPAEHGGDFSIGIKADYAKAWYGAINYTYFFGRAGGVVNPMGQLSYDQQLKDRNFISLSLQHTF